MQALLNEKYASIKVERDQWEKDKEEMNECISSSLLDQFYQEDFKKEDMYLDYCNYEMNFNVKQLIIIGEYYGLKNIKKANKLAIIYTIIEFENNVENHEIVSRRKILWSYIDELKKDKFMKKYILF